jgi:DNA-binding protein H-NS
MARTTVEAQLVKIRQQVKALEAKEKALLAKASDKVIAEIVALAKKHNVTIEELAAAFGKTKVTRKMKAPIAAKKASGNRAKVAPKYRHPDDASKTWTGRGKSPLWVQALKDAGILDSALIAAR